MLHDVLEKSFFGNTIAVYAKAAGAILGGLLVVWLIWFGAKKLLFRRPAPRAA